MEENICKICGEKLKKKSGEAIYFCMKCDEQKKAEKDISEKLKGN